MEGPSSHAAAALVPLWTAGRRTSGAAAESDQVRDTKTHFRVCRFILETGVKLGMRSVPVATACVLYHRFFERVNIRAYEPYLVAMSCMYLAGKVEEQHIRTRDILNVSHRYFNSGSAPLECDKEFWDLRDSVVQCELLILRQLNFHVSFEHPHKYLLHYLLSVKSLVNRHAWSRTPVAETCWALLRDCYHGAMCIRHTPQHIAIATLYLALNSYGVELPVGEKEWWQEMRRHSKKKNVILAVLLVAGGLYFINHSDFLIAVLTKSHEPTPHELSWEAGRLVSKESWVEQGDFLPLNVSYQLLAGAPSTQQRYLSVGLSSVKRKKGSYLIPTLQSLFSQSSPEECSSMVVVVLLADFDVSWRVTTVREIKTAFASELEQGHLVVLHVPEEWYPPLTGLKRNYNDAPERVSFRSKQNLDYSFLIHYSTGLGRYYLQLEDDVSSAKNFLSTIKRHVEEQEAKKTTWAMLEFSALGFIGKLYRSAHLPLLARFLFLFYQEMPCDWLMSHFRELLTQKKPIILKPSLFQHMGTFSSFQGTYNKLKDKDFEEGLYSNPPAEVYSDMSTYQKHFPKLAWDAGEGFFWGRSPEKGNHLTVVFADPTVVTEIFVETGSGGKDLLESALVEIGHTVVTTEKEGKSCKEFQSVGTIENGGFKMQGINKKYDSASSCLRIQVTAGQKDWVIITKIRITTKPSAPSHPAQV